VRPYPPTDPAEAGQEAYINADVFREAFAGGLDQPTTAAMAASQRPIDLAVLQQPSGPPAWEAISSWFIIGQAITPYPPTSIGSWPSAPARYGPSSSERRTR
jgi:hypothetical protein